MKSDTKKIFSLFQLLESVENMVSKTYSQYYWIRAEMIKLNHFQQQHCYPEFVEKKGDEIIAEIRGTIWSSTFLEINERFKSIVGEPLKDGMKVVMLVKLNFTPKRGLSINIVDIDPQYTLGDMMVQKTKTLEKLKKDGLINKNKLLPDPKLPKKIAIISVKSSKGYQDFNNVMAKYAQNYQPLCVLYTAILQGEKAVGSIQNALNQIKDKKDFFDFVLILRGGGNEVGLTCYDDYQLAAEIANFPIPILTGIGHSTNETVTEIVAWKNLITPTEAAYYIIRYFERFDKELQILFQKIADFSIKNIYHQFLQIKQTATFLKWSVKRQLNTHLKIVFSLQNKLNFSSERFLSSKENNLLQINHQLKTVPIQFLQKKRHQLEINALKTNLFNPKNTLVKGFSITRKNGNVVKSNHEVKTGDVIITYLNDGTIKSVVS